jgi:hypothetical protein
VSVTCCRQHFKNSISNIQHCHHLSSISTQYAKENLHGDPLDSLTGCEVAESLCLSLMLSFQTAHNTVTWYQESHCHYASVAEERVQSKYQKHQMCHLQGQTQV